MHSSTAAAAAGPWAPLPAGPSAGCFPAPLLYKGKEQDWESAARDHVTVPHPPPYAAEGAAAAEASGASHAFPPAAGAGAGASGNGTEWAAERELVEWGADASSSARRAYRVYTNVGASDKFGGRKYDVHAKEDGGATLIMCFHDRAGERKDKPCGLAQQGSFYKSDGSLGIYGDADKVALIAMVDGHQLPVPPSEENDRGWSAGACAERLRSHNERATAAHDELNLDEHAIGAKQSQEDGTGSATSCAGTDGRPCSCEPDLAFVLQIMDELADNYCVDLREVYAIGFGGGGRMALEMAVAPPTPKYGMRVKGVIPIMSLPSTDATAAFGSWDSMQYVPTPYPLADVAGNKADWPGPPPQVHNGTADDSVGAHSQAAPVHVLHVHGLEDDRYPPQLSVVEDATPPSAVGAQATGGGAWHAPDGGGNITGAHGTGAQAAQPQQKWRVDATALGRPQLRCASTPTESTTYNEGENGPDDGDTTVCLAHMHAAWGAPASGDAPLSSSWESTLGSKNGTAAMHAGVAVVREDFGWRADEGDAGGVDAEANVPYECYSALVPHARSSADDGLNNRRYTQCLFEEGHTKQVWFDQLVLDWVRCVRNESNCPE